MGRYGETQRIVGLDINNANPTDLTKFLRYTHSDMELREIQNTSLYRIMKANGGLISVGVGHGKFLISALAPTVLDSHKTVLLVPPNLVKQTEVEINKWSTHFRILGNGHLTVLSYGKVSVVEGFDILGDLKPDLIIADECHYLRNKKAARTKRVIRYFQSYPNTRFVGLSGTMTSRSITDLDHLSELALRSQSPIPRSYRALKSWSACIDVNPVEAPTHSDFREIKDLLAWAMTDSPREAFQLRFSSSPGIVTSNSDSYEGSLVISAHQHELHDDTIRALITLKQLWRTPSGQDLDSPLDFSRVSRQLLQGYYTKWVWPNGIVDEEWLEARNTWASACGHYINRNSNTCDSPKQVSILCETRAITNDVLVAWDKWCEHKHKPTPNVIACWIDDSMIDTSIMSAHEGTLIWCESPHILAKFKEKGIPTYGAGEEIPEEEIRTIALSRRAHGTGKNLQRYSHNIALMLPPNGSIVEQLFGRTHRPGQKEDTVQWTVLMPSSQNQVIVRGLSQVFKDAQYLESVSGQVTKVLAGQWVGF